MPALLEALLAFAGLVLAYVWISLPWLRPYSLQATAVFFALYFVSKRLKRSGWHEILPSGETFEAAFLVGAVALVVGYTGGLNSPFLPLFYILLFLTALSLRLSTNVIELFGITLFLWATSSHPFTRDSWISLLAFPFLLPLLAFARMQFDQANEEKCLLAVEERTLDSEEKRMAKFLLEFTVPKLRAIRDLLRVTPGNAEIAARQIILLEDESIKLLNSLHADVKVREAKIDEPKAAAEPET
jgi:hypothetical protein